VERVAPLWDKDVSVMNKWNVYVMMLEMNCLVEIVIIDQTGIRIVLAFYYH